MTATLPDADARRAILTLLDANLVVEAAAGTGKTTCLVGRLMNLFRRGALTGESRLAAVTFTHKAAAELRERLDRELDKALAGADSLDPETAANLRAAAAALPECHIGTIHSFCARLLRERPVEAGVGPDFQELDDSDDKRLRQDAWNEFARRLAQGLHDDINRVFETFGMDLSVLAGGFETYAEYPDVESWTGLDATVEAINVDLFVLGLRDYRPALDRLGPQLQTAAAGRDELIPALQVLDRRLARLEHADIDLNQAVGLANLLKESPELVQTMWKQFGFGKDEAKDFHADYGRFYDATVKPFRDACMAALHAAAMESFRIAREIYDSLRRENRLLNFQDLLMRAAAMLRDFPEVRDDLAGRYARLLVDEVQDTDPVQAEIMFLLAAEPGAPADWRGRRLRPGALFMVGDPKQSIYRFRRADIQVYQEMKRLVADQGGGILGLSTNFRSRPDLIAWVNRTFADGDTAEKTPEQMAYGQRFGFADTPYSPAYIPLEPGLPNTPPECFGGVYSLELIPVVKATGVGERQVRENEAERIAAFIRRAVDAGLPLPGRDGPRPAAPGDFLVITHGKKHGGVYAAAIRAKGLTCQVSCGGTLADSETLALLLAYLKALASPDDPVLLLAVLRGGLSGVSDVDLHRWKKAGGRFDFVNPGRDADGSPIAAILAAMAAHRRLCLRRDPLAALARIVDDLGLWAHAGLGDDPSVSAGILAAALDLLAKQRRQLPTLGHVAERLEWLMQNHEDDPAPVRVRPEAAVRIMNMHKTKGLEAPVVFLTCTRRVVEHPATMAIRRDADGVVGAMAMYKGEFRNVPVSMPLAWEDIAREEELYLAAEKVRLNYVAATRAGAALIVSIHKSNKIWQTKFLPRGYEYGVTIENKLPEPEEPVAPPCDATHMLDASALVELAAERERRREIMLTESYRTMRAKPDAEEPVAADETALDRGEVLHRLLAAEAVSNNAARSLLREYGLPEDEAGDLAAMVDGVRRSVLWRRAERARTTLREVPFSVRLDGAAAPLLLRGVVDLAFREDGGWVVVDYKSDRLAADADPATAAARHAEQLAAYAKAWEKLFGEPVIETGIYFLRPGWYVTL